MEKFEVTILGCGSAKPSLRHYPSSQVVTLRDKCYMIDCGEGTQLQLARNKISYARLDHIFISHLHGDHCFGLIGLISTFGLYGRTRTMHIYAPKELESVLQLALHTFCRGLTYKVEFHPINTSVHQLVFENRAIEVWTLPLRHRIPTTGYLFVEKPTLPHIKRDMIDFYHIPFYAINDIKEGADWITPDGEAIPATRLTTPAAPPRKYAYVSDTIYTPKLQQYLEDTDLLYHEATFGNDYAARAAETFHSTAQQAATLALDCKAKRLCIGHYSSRYTDERPLLEQAQAIFPNTILAKEGLTISI